MARFINSRNINIHQVPGSIRTVESPGGEKVSIHRMRWNKDALREDSPEPEELLNEKFHKGSDICWIDIYGLPDSSFLTRMGEILKLHQLTLEDITNVGHSPKYEHELGYHYLVARMFRIDEGRVLSEQINFILRDNLLITIQQRKGDVFEPLRNRIRNSMGRIRTLGAGYLMYALSDLIVDNFILVVEHIGEQIEEFDDQIFVRSDNGVISDIRSWKRDISTLMHFALPLREIYKRAAGSGRKEIDPVTLPFFMDLGDHIDLVESALGGYREMLKDQLNTHTALQANRMNEVMKVLTVISTIFIPLTFIAGIYGMNFQYMPELSFRFAYPVVMGIMLVMAGIMVGYFRRKSWIGSPRPKKSKRNFVDQSSLR